MTQNFQFLALLGKERKILVRKVVDEKRECADHAAVLTHEWKIVNFIGKRLSMEEKNWMETPVDGQECQLSVTSMMMMMV